MTALINSSVLKGFVNIVIYILIAALSVVLFLNLGESLYFKEYRPIPDCFKTDDIFRQGPFKIGKRKIWL